MKNDDTSLTPEQFQTVHTTARTLLSKGAAWGRLPTPVDDLLAAAQLKKAPINAFDERAMQHYLRQTGEAAHALLRKAIDKVLGVFDVHADTIHVDPTVSLQKQNFLSLHEAGHKELPHQRGLYRWIQDCRRFLEPGTAALFEREANTFAQIVLFQDDTFARITADSAFGIKVPLKVAKDFGASAYAGMREYVRSSHRACAVVVLNPPVETEFGQVVPVRRVEVSQSFHVVFGALTLPSQLPLDSEILRFVPFGKSRMSAPDTLVLTDRNGARHEFVAEGFKTPYNTFVLMHAAVTPNRLILGPGVIANR